MMFLRNIVIKMFVVIIFCIFFVSEYFYFHTFTERIPILQRTLAAKIIVKTDKYQINFELA